MNKTLFYNIIFNKIGLYLSSKVYNCTKMVRHFPNHYEDYKPGVEVNLSKTEILAQIHDHVNSITKGLPPTEKHVDGGLYVGISGVSYMFYHLAKNHVLSNDKQQSLKSSLQYLKPALKTSSMDQTSFLLGAAGTYALASVIYKQLGDDQYKQTLNSYKSLYSLYLKPKFLKCGGDEFFVGRSGYIAGALWMSRELGTQVLSRKELHTLCDIIVNSGKEYAACNHSPCPLMYHYYNTEYLGAAHGVSFILQMLLTVPGYLDHNKAAANDIKSTIDFMASIQTADGNWPTCMEEAVLSEHKLVHWCHGAPGTVYLMAKAYLVYKDQKYLDACIKAADLVWSKGLLHKGPGICHGVAGNGYVFLLLYRLTHDLKYLHRAKMFADFMVTEQFQRDAKQPDNPLSLYEGLAGTVCYLADLLIPDQAEFPFQDVFSAY